MKIWSVANQKGGVGKTTTAVTLGGLLAASGSKTLLVDLDPHGSLTAYFGYDPDTMEHSVYSLFRPEPLPKTEMLSVIKDTSYEGLSLLPASTALATLDRQLGAQEGMGLVIGRTLAQLSDHYDYAFIDCPPVLGVLMVNALAACEELLIPVQTEFLALKGLERMLRTLSMVTRARRHPLKYTIIPTMFDKRTRASHESLKFLRETYPEQIWRSVIPVDTQFREASRRGAPLSMINPHARGVIAYTELLANLQGVQAERMVEVQ